MNAIDQRTSDQKDQADRATARDIKTANALESARLQQEAKDLAANTPPRQALSTNSKPDKKTVLRNKKLKPVRIKTPPVQKTTILSAQKKSKKS